MQTHMYTCIFSLYMWKEYCFTNPTRYTYIHPEIPSSFWHDNFSVPRRYITTIIRIKFGHACYPVHLFKIKILTTDKCAACNTTGHLDHIFFECKNNVEASNKLYLNLLNSNVLPPFNLLSLLCQNNRKILDCVISFFK